MGGGCAYSDGGGKLLRIAVPHTRSGRCQNKSKRNRKGKGRMVHSLLPQASGLRWGLREGDKQKLSGEALTSSNEVRYLVAGKWKGEGKFWTATQGLTRAPCSGELEGGHLSGAITRYLSSTGKDGTPSTQIT